MSSIVQFDPRLEQSDGEKLGDQISELCGYIYAATHHLLELIREFDEQRYWAELGFQSCAHWLNFKCGFGMNSARERIRTAHHVERLVSQYRRAKKLQDAEFANDLHRKREVTYYYDHDGCLVMKARIPADQGKLIVKALEMAMEDSDFEEPVAVRRADALTQVAETYMNNSENSGSTADRYQVVVHVTAETSVRDPYLEKGPHVSAETSRRVACDCSTTTIKEDETGEPLSIGRRSRTIPPPMRRALKARDAGCRFPGCTNHKFVDGHHIKHWADGGETSLENLVSLCRFHHHLVHEGGFACKRSKDGEIWFEDRRKHRLDDIPRMSDAALEESLAWMYRKFDNRDVTAETPVAKWYAGEEMDWNHAVSLMFNQ